MTISLFVLAAILAVLSYISPPVEKAVRVTAYALVVVYLLRGLL
jgi:hypothetical protein